LSRASAGGGEAGFGRSSLEKAQKKLSALVKDAVASEPTIITRNGEKVAVILSVSDYRNLPGVRFGMDVLADEESQPRE
jgi:prevent-host-death family protein